MNQRIIAATAAAILITEASAQSVVLFETFEGNFPQDNSWSIKGTNASWGKVSTGFGGRTAVSGDSFAYCAAVRADGKAAVPVYPSNMDGMMEKPLDLSQFASATLSFWYLMPDIPTSCFGGCDSFRVLIDTNIVFGPKNGSQVAWQPITINLRNYTGGTHNLRFEFTSGSEFLNHEGLYLDNILVLGQKTLPESASVNDPATDLTSRNTQNEPSIIIGDGGSILIAFNDSGSLDASTNRFTGWSVSTNYGASFLDKGILPSGVSGDAGDPIFARDAGSGLIYLATMMNPLGPRLQFFRSVDNGRTFQAPINAAPGFKAGDGLDKPWLAVDNYTGAGRGNVYLVFRDFPTGQAGSQQPLIYFNASTDKGTTWGVPKIIGSGHGAYVAAGPAHEVYVFWLSGNRILASKSVDEGRTFGLASTIAPIASSDADGDLGLPDVRTDSFPRAAVNPVTGDIYVVYNDRGIFPEDLADIFITVSRDRGTSWTEPKRVNQDYSLRSQWFPCVSVSPDGRDLFVAWYDRRLEAGDGETTIYGIFGGVAATNVIPGFEFRIGDNLFWSPTIADRSVVSYLGDYVQSVSDNEFFYFAWTDTRTRNPDVRFTKVPIPDRFSAFRLQSDGAHIRLNTNPGRSYSLEVSADLRTWNAVTNFVATDFSIEVTDATGRASAPRFYRASAR